MKSSSLHLSPSSIDRLRAETSPSPWLTASVAIPAPRACLGILIEDAMNRRLIEDAALRLELLPVFLSRDSWQLTSFEKFELIVAEEAFAEKVRSNLVTRAEQVDGLHPVVVALRDANSDATPGMQTDLVRPDRNCDGVLTLPLDPASATEQLGLILYAHRAFERRYQSALEELHLDRRIFNSVTSGITIASASLPDMPLVYVNPAFEKMTGYSFAEIQGQNCRFLQGAETDQPALDEIRRAFRERREVTVLLRNYRKDGTAFWNELALSMIRNREGAITHVVGVQSDVTARVEFEAALRESEKLAAVGRLASSIAHEINNPLESVMNLLYLAQQPGNDGESRGYLQLADQELQRIALITSQSLSFYKQSTNPQAISCGELCKSVLDVHEQRAERMKIRVGRRVRSKTEVICLESEIRQVLNNLVRNAMDAMGGSGGKLLIRGRDATDWRTGQAGILITIADTGSGISAHTMRSLFQPFHTTKGIAGTGLGLWISNEIVARHGGRLSVRSRQGEHTSGTIFRLFLPAGPCLAGAS